MIYRSLLILFSMLSARAMAWDWDLTHDALARSYPIGGIYQARAGVSQRFWDKQQQSPPLYGFTRAGAVFRSSAVINTAEGELAVYPISILGLFRRESYGVRRLNALDTFDCDQVDCRGEIRRSEWGARTALAFRGIFTMHEWRRLSLRPSTEGLIWADEMTTTELPNRKVRQHIRLSILGYQWDDHWAVGILNLDNQVRAPIEEKTYKLMALTQYKQDSWVAALAGGVFHNRFGNDVLSILAIWKWNYRMGDMLF